MVFPRKTILGLGLCLIFWGAAFDACMPPAVSGSGPGFQPAGVTVRYKLDLKVMGRRRSYLLHSPPRASAGEALPLVVVIHGAFSTAREMEKITRFSRLADRERFLVAYPEGAYGILGFLQHWNAGFCCGKAASDKLDDVGFLQTVIADAGTRFPVDPSRVYLTGFSNGGMLAHRFAAEHPEVLAAAAPVAASHGGRASSREPVWIVPRPRLPVPILILHGTADRNVPYAGGTSPRSGGEREYLSAAAAAEFWAEADGCLASPAVEEERGGAVERRSWRRPGAAGPDVFLVTLIGWDHRWPGPHFTERLSADDLWHGFDAAELIWDFFKSFRRGSVPPSCLE